MKKLSTRNFIFIGLTLFSMFFGAGNLIFPPYSANQAGLNMLPAMLGITISAVVFPILGVATVAKTDGLDGLASRVHPIFATIFSVLIYLSIGPLIAIPRASTVPFEMAFLPYLPEGLNPKIALLLFTFVFFALTFWLSLNPSKLVSRMGKILTPIMIALILLIFVSSLLGKNAFAPAVAGYAVSPFIQGFLDGYQTMDVTAALVFGQIVALMMRDYNIEDKSVIVKSTIKTGIIAGVCLGVIYFMIGYVGANGSMELQTGENGAQILARMVIHNFGFTGIIILAIVFILACLTTCVGLVTACSDYFHKLLPKISYRNFVIIITLFSFAISNQGLDKILTFSVPVLVVLYPACFVLIGLGLSEKFFHGHKFVYRLTVAITILFSIFDVFKKALGEMTWFHHIPFASKGLAWVLPSLVMYILSTLIVRSKIVQSKH